MGENCIHGTVGEKSEIGRELERIIVRNKVLKKKREKKKTTSESGPSLNYAHNSRRKWVHRARTKTEVCLCSQSASVLVSELLWGGFTIKPCFRLPLCFARRQLLCLVFIFHSRETCESLYSRRHSVWNINALPFKLSPQKQRNVPAISPRHH